MAISRSAVLVALGVLTFVLAVSLALSKSPQQKQEIKESGKAAPNQLVTLLPSSYSDRPPPRPTPPPPSLGPAPGSELIEALAAAERERQKRLASARLAGVAFTGLTIGTGSRGRLESEIQNTDRLNAEQQNPRDEANRQDDKLSFLSDSRDRDIELDQRIKPPTSPYTLLAGTVIPGVMLSGINSDLPGQLLGQVSQNVFDSVSGKYLLVPQGTRVLGSYDSRIVYGQERVLVVWTRLVFPNGDSISLEGMPGVDLSGYAGLSDQVDNHYLRLLSGVVFSSLLGAAAQVAEGPTYNTQDPSY